MGEEGIAESLAFVGAFHQASDVGDVQESGHFAERGHIFHV